MSETVNHPPHYNKHPSGVECIEIIRWFPYNVGAVIKHLWRAGLKTDRLEDLQKALVYLENEIEREQQIREGANDEHSYS